MLTVTISSENHIPVIRFNVIGSINAPRSISAIETSNNLEKDDIIRYLVNRSEEDLHYFRQWLDDQLFDGKFQDTPQYFLDLLDESEMFNRLLNARIIRYSSSGFKLVR
ncbi:hypothetical protein FC698_15740 [Bacillus cereus]|uniref:hypothetical protein n=1 Tax=Bacillus cereus TaxID=1396 RepID=UPI0010BF1110|nr:hypothetical protein [Bacillus cereus]TKH47372.1 hypothetical protein FC698_15740 [Bacillus cereus]